MKQAYQEALESNNVAQLDLDGQVLFYLRDSKKQGNTYTVDIIPGTYEGGHKIWECEIDLLRFISKNLRKQLEGKRVLEMGCGQGLIGILANKLGCNIVCLQDYNEDVIQNTTRETVRLNLRHPEEIQKFNFVFGDWETLECLEDQYDVILGSELIYNQQNYLKIIKFLKKFMRKDGKCILANKHYYFGVGGNMTNFKNCLESNGFKLKSLLKIEPLKGGNKKEIIQIFY